jgi:hypothetical protein
MVPSHLAPPLKPLCNGASDLFALRDPIALLNPPQCITLRLVDHEVVARLAWHDVSIRILMCQLKRTFSRVVRFAAMGLTPQREFWEGHPVELGDAWTPGSRRAGKPSPPNRRKPPVSACDATRAPITLDRAAERNRPVEPWRSRRCWTWPRQENAV